MNASFRINTSFPATFDVFNVCQDIDNNFFRAIGAGMLNCDPERVDSYDVRTTFIGEYEHELHFVTILSLDIHPKVTQKSMDVIEQNIINAVSNGLLDTHVGSEETIISYEVNKNY